ncbi:MAG: hypothetical protein ACI843_000877 [Psychrobacter glaciei]
MDDHRMVVGSGDELGSKGFNQIQNAYTYGARSSLGNLKDGPRCHHVSAYTLSGKSAINTYDPGINIIAMAAFAAGKPGDCGRSFYIAFSHHSENPTNTDNPGASYTATHKKKGAVIKRLKTGSVYDAVTGDYKDDTYDQLKKAIGAYNQGQGIFNKTTSWSELLLIENYSAGTGKEDKTVVTAMKYAMGILQDSTRGIALPKRQYIWEGEAPKDKNNDGETKNKEADPTAIPPVLESIEEGWCFEYGETEWVDGKLFKTVKESAKGDLFAVPVILPIGRLNCTTGVALK